MKVLTGIPVSPGIAIGKAFLYSEDRLSVPSYEISPGQVSYELERFESAVGRATRDVEALLGRSGDDLGDTERKLLESHRLMLTDPELAGRVAGELKSSNKNVESVLLTVVDALTKKLESTGDAYLRERASDIRDIGNRVLRHLLYPRSPLLMTAPPWQIVPSPSSGTLPQAPPCTACR